MSAAFETMSSLVLEDGRRWGEAAEPLQRDDARAVLAESSGLRRHWLGRARGWSKTTDVAGMTVALMLEQAPPGARLYGAAADREQARLIMDSVGGFVGRTPELMGALVVDQYRATSRTGVIFEALASDSSSAFGLRPWLLVLDELTQWPDTWNARRFHEALTSALPKVPGSRMVVISTAGSPSSWQRKEYDAAIGESGLWRVSEVHGVPPWVDAKLIAAERRRLPASSFARLWENRWTETEDRLFRFEDVAACATLDGPLPFVFGVSYLVTVDLGWRRDATVIVVSHREEPGRVIVDRLDVARASHGQSVDLDGVEARVVELAGEYGAATVRVDPREAVGMIGRWRGMGLGVIEHTFSVSSNSQLALRLLELVREHRLSIPEDESLIDELVNVRLVERGPGLYRVDHDASRHDDQAVAIGMACVHWAETPSWSFAGLVEAHRGDAALTAGIMDMNF